MVQEELEFDGKKYISSKRAAQLSDYAHDYIGQLCRSGTVDCKRVGGLWYVTVESLEKNKSMSAEIKARAFSTLQSLPHREVSDTVLTFSGEEYVSSKYGAEITGYNPDYITQLARGSKIRAKQMGSRWYVARKDLMDNKEKNDALLAAVQTESVGLQKRDEKLDIYNKKTELAPSKYSEDSSPLMPTMERGVQTTSEEKEESWHEENETLPRFSDQTAFLKNTVGEHVLAHKMSQSGIIAPKRYMPVKNYTFVNGKKERQTSNRRFIVFGSLIFGVATIFLIASTYINTKKTHISASRIADSATVSSSLKYLSGLDFNENTIQILMLLITDILHYERIE